MPVLLVQDSELLRRTVTLVTTVHAAHGTTDRLGNAMLSTVRMAVSSSNVVSSNVVSTSRSNAAMANSSTIKPTSRPPSRCSQTS